MFDCCLFVFGVGGWLRLLVGVIGCCFGGLVVRRGGMCVFGWVLVGIRCGVVGL